MGNLGFIVPTQKLEDFNQKKIYSLLKEQFPKLDIESEGDSISVYHTRRNEKDLICNLYFNQDCYVLDYDRDIIQIENITKESEGKKYHQEIKERNQELIKSLEELKKLNPDLNNVIQTTYGYGRSLNIKDDVDFFIKDYFNGYLFDEGIHPEFMQPGYVRRSEGTSLLKKLSQLFS